MCRMFTESNLWLPLYHLGTKTKSEEICNSCMPVAILGLLVG